MLTVNTTAPFQVGDQVAAHTHVAGKNPNVFTVTKIVSRGSYLLTDKSGFSIVMLDYQIRKI